MRHSLHRKALSWVMTLVMIVSLLAGLRISVSAATLTGTATGYTKASDVVYDTSGDYVKNWGARGEVCTFLTSYAQAYYTGNYSYETLAANSGSSSPSSYTSSALYTALQSMVRAKQTTTTSYDETRGMYKYTDCVNNNISYISSFYSATRFDGAWDSGKTWNREHVWPNSKADDDQDNDIMMLRPVASSENSSRGNKAYGESAGFYDPSTVTDLVNVRGDAARIVLYCYVRWSNQQYMWGSSGVMESVDVLLRWIEEDPVDTWEMGRNDVTESITGVRNVFVDYPELAFQLFGETVPANYTTPSRGASESYTVTATSNNTDYGTVSVSGYTITANPKPGYYAAGSMVTSGNATVTQNGNTFTVEPSSDCTVQINFAAQTQLTVTYMANGSQYDTATCDTGESLTLPSTATEVSGWTVSGWSTTEFDDTTEQPTYYALGDSFTPTDNTTLYAVYVKTESGAGSGDYVKVTSSGDLVSGTYLIVYEEGSVAMDGGLTSLDAVSNTIAVIISNNTIPSTSETDAASFTIDMTVGTIRSASGYYIGWTSNNTNGLDSSNSTAYTNTITISGESASVKSSGGAYLRFNSDTGQTRFRYYKSSTYTKQKPIQLYIKSSGVTTTYTTSPGEETHTHTLVKTAATPATCEGTGNTEYYTCSGCGKYFSDAAGTTEIQENSWVIPALGHEWGFEGFTWTGNDTDGYTAAVANYKCGRDENHTTTVVAELSRVSNGATCTQAGTIVYTATVSAANSPDGTEHTDAKTVTGAALGHDYELTGWTWAEDFSTATATFTCKNDESHVETVAAVITSETTPARCETTGKTVYTATAAFEGQTYTDTKEATIPATGHVWGEAVFSWIPKTPDECVWVETTWNDITEEDVIAITMSKGGETFVLPTEGNGSKGQPLAVNLTEAAFEVSGASFKTTGTDLIGWIRDGAEGSYKLRTSRDSSKYLYSINDNNGLRIGTIGSYLGTLGLSAETYLTLSNSSSTRYIGVYDEADWRVYESIISNIASQTLQFWKLKASEEEVYDAATATRTCQTDPTHTETVNATVTSEAVTVTCETAGETVYTAIATFSDGTVATGTKTVTVPALGHDYALTGWTWAEDHSTAAAVFTCRNDASHVENVAAVITSQTTAATCEAVGMTVYTATATFDGQTYTDVEEVAIPALGHEWTFTGFTWTGSDEAGYTAAAAGYVCENDAAHIETREATLTKTSTGATCTVPGTIVYTVTITAEASLDREAHTEEKTVSGAALGHDYELTGWTWAEDFSTATATFTCKNDASHVETVAAVITSETMAAGCETAGKTVYTATAAFEGQTYTDTKEASIPATGHVWGEAVFNWIPKTPDECVWVQTTWDDITEEDVIAITMSKGQVTYLLTSTNGTGSAPTAKLLSTVDADYVVGDTSFKSANSDGFSWIRESKDVGYAFRVNGTTDKYLYSTNTNDGVRVGAFRTAGGIFNLDEASGYLTVNTATKRYMGVYLTNPDWRTYGNTTGNITDQTLQFWKLKASEEEVYDAATATRTCQTNPTHKETVNATVTSETTVATCEEAGKTVYTASAVFDGETYTETKEVPIPAIGHDYELTGWSWAEDFNTAAVVFTCKNDASHVENVTATVTSETTAATCEAAGKITYTATATFEGQTYTATEEEVIPATGHDWNDPVFVWADDAYTATATRTCKNDTDHVEELGVTVTSAVTTAPSCEGTGVRTYTASVTIGETTYTSTKEETIPATGHEWTFAGFIWTDNDGTGEKTAAASYICTKDETHTETVEAEITKRSTDATCTEAGTVVYTATVSAEASLDGKTHSEEKTETGTALGHNYELTGWAWAEDFSTASATFTCKNDASHVETVTAVVASETTAPTCEAAGKIVYTATAAFEGETYTDEKEVAIPAIGHDYGEPTYTWAEDYSTVTAKMVCANDATHVVEETVNTTAEITKAATCEAKGETTYTATFTNEAFASQTKTVENIDALGHDYELTGWSWAEDYSNASATFTCKNDATHVETVTATITSTTTAATCEAAGETVYTATAVFDGETYTETKEVPIPATGHDYELTGWTWAEDFSTAAATFTCKNDATHVETVTATVTSETAAATCEAAGKTIYTATATFEGKTYTDTQEVMIPAIGHNYGEPTYIWAEDYSTVTAKMVCANDATHVVEETVNTTAEITKAATCEAKGETTYTATFTNEAFATRSQTVANIDALGHDWEFKGFTWTGDDEAGYTAAVANYTCKRDAEHTKTAEATIMKTSTDATCTEAGTVVYIASISAEASPDGEAHSESKTVTGAPLGHDYELTDWTWAEDFSTASATFTCKNDASHVEEVNATVTSETTAATCETAGKTVYTATAVFEGKTYTDSKEVTVALTSST